MNIWPQSWCKSHSKSSRTYIIHWRCPLKNALNAGREMMLVYVTWPHICLHAQNTMMIRFVANLRALSTCVLGLAHSHTHREIVLMPKYGDSIKLEIKFYNSGDSFPYLHFWTHFSFFSLPGLICLGGSPRGSCFSWLILLSTAFAMGISILIFRGWLLAVSAALALPHLLNVVASQS